MVILIIRLKADAMHELQSPLYGCIFKKYQSLSQSLPFFCSGRCKIGYVAYNYTDHQICLKFVNNPASYIEASAQCQIEGGNLFKMDTKLKHDILTEYLGMLRFKLIETFRCCFFINLLHILVGRSFSKILRRILVFLVN